MIEKFGKLWPDNTTTLQIHLTLYLHATEPEEKFQHFRTAYSLLFPELVSTWNTWTEEMMRVWCEETRIGGGVGAVLGASGTGKSMSFGYFAVLDWLAAPDDTIILCASTTIAELNSRIWKYVRRAYTNIPFKVGKLRLSKPEAIISANLEAGIYATALDGDPEGEGLKGFHPKRLRIIVDEATAIKSAIMNTWINWISANKNFALFTLSNFRGLDNLSAKVTEPLLGWTSIDYETKTSWKTKVGGQALLLDALRSPVYKQPQLKHKLPFLKTKEEIDAIIFGTLDVPGLGATHPRVMQYIRSIPTFDEGVKSVLTQKLITRGGADKAATWAGWGQTKLLSLDPAFTTSGDEVILQPGILGYERDGVQVLEFGDPISIPLNSNTRIPVEYQILDYVVGYAKKQGIPPENFVMDGGGSGRGLGSIFQYEWSDKILVIMPGYSASEDMVDVQLKKTAKDIYDRLVTELWFEFRRFVETSQIRKLPPAAQAQFCARVYDDSKIKIRLETKPEYKLRISGSDSVKGSPDEADAGTYLLYLAKMHGLRLAARERTYESVIAPDPRTPNERAVQDWVDKRTNAWQDQQEDQQQFDVNDCDYSGAVID